MGRALDEIVQHDRRGFCAEPERRDRCRSPDAGGVDLCDCDRAPRLVMAIRHLWRDHVAYQAVDIAGRDAPLNHLQAEDSARESVRSVEAQGSDTQAASGLLMCLVVLMLIASAMISLTLLWFAIRGIQWLLLQ